MNTNPKFTHRMLLRSLPLILLISLLRPNQVRLRLLQQITAGPRLLTGERSGYVTQSGEGLVFVTGDKRKHSKRHIFFDLQISKVLIHGAQLTSQPFSDPPWLLSLVLRLILLLAELRWQSV